MQWLDFVNAQLGGFLHRKVHAFATRDALQESDAEWRFGIMTRSLADPQNDPVFLQCGNDGSMFAAVVGKNTEIAANFQAQNPGQVVSSFAIHLKIPVRRNGLVDIKSVS